MPRLISEEERAMILCLFSQGWAKKAISRHIDRSPSTVAEVLGAEGRGARRRRESERKIKPPPARPIGPLPVLDTGWIQPPTKARLMAGK